MLHNSTNLQFLNRITHSSNLAKFGPRLPIPFNLLMNLGRRIGNNKILPVLNLLLMRFQQIPQLFLHDPALGMQRTQINHQRLQYIAISPGQNPIIHSPIVFLVVETGLLVVI